MPSLPRIADYGLPFVGRRQELAQIEQYFEQGARLVTLFGTAGVGKTRLAVHFLNQFTAHDLTARSYIGDLSTAQTPDEMLATLVRSWLIESPPGQQLDPAALIARWINTRGTALILLDNFEQLVESSAKIIDDWLKLCPNALFLVTSRHKLALAGERVVEVAALPLPPKEANDPQIILANESVKLFLQCANVTLEPTSVTLDHAKLLSEIVHQLEGNPLAIALAAARLEVMTLRVLRERLNERFEVLRNPTVKSTNRHATLYAAIDWSWSLLSTAERSVLAQLSVFDGGFTIDAAEAIVQLPPQEALHVSVLDIIHSLSRKSLLHHSTVHESLSAPRFAMYTSVAEYALGKLRAGAVNVSEIAVRERFGQWVLATAQALSAGVDQADGPIVLQQLLAEYHNIQAFLRITMAQPPTEATATMVLTLALALDPLLSLRTPTHTASELLGQILRYAQQVPAITTAKLYAAVLVQRAIVLRYGGALPQTLQSIEQALAIFTKYWPEEHTYIGRCLRVRATVHYLSNEAEQAKTVIYKAREKYELAPSADMCEIDTTLGMITLDAGDLAAAQQHFAQAVVVARAHNHARLTAKMLGNLATFQTEMGDLTSARQNLEQALKIHRAYGSIRNEAAVLGQLGALQHLLGNLDAAAKHYQQVIEMLGEVGDIRYFGYFQYYSAILSIEQNHLTTAAGQLQQAESALQSVHDPRYEALICAARVALLALQSPTSNELQQQLAKAKELVAKVHDKNLPLVIEVYSALVEVVTASPTGITTAEETLNRLQKTPADDIRLALRILQRVVTGQLNREKTWQFGDGSIWFRPPGQESVSLENRGTLARILDILVKARMQSPGVALSVKSLSQSAWPDTKLVKDAAQNRVHVALSTLRKLGLEPIIVRTRSGYYLDDKALIEQLSTESTK